MHCVSNFTGKPELGITQDQVALQRALRDINQFTADRQVLPHIIKAYPFDEVVAAHRHMDECPCGGRVVLVLPDA